METKRNWRVNDNQTAKKVKNVFSCKFIQLYLFITNKVGVVTFVSDFGVLKLQLLTKMKKTVEENFF